MTENRLGLGVSLGAAALALGLGVGAGHLLHRLAAQPTAAVTRAASSSSELKRYMVPVTDSQPQLGPKDALVTIVQWCDLPDTGCARFEPTVRKLLADNPETVRFVFRHYGRPEHTGSPIAHYLARAAHQQAGKFWEARSLLLAHPGDMTMAAAEQYATQLGLSWKDVRAAIENRTYATPVTADRVFAGMFDVEQSPAFFVNGRPLGKLATPEQLAQLVDDELHRTVDLIATGVDKANVYAELTKHGAWNKPNVQ